MQGHSQPHTQIKTVRRSKKNSKSDENTKITRKNKSTLKSMLQTAAKLSNETN